MELSDPDVTAYLADNGVAVSGRFKAPKTLVAERPCSLADVKIDRDLTIGAYTYIGPGSEIRSAVIGRFCSIARRVVMAPAEHPIDSVTTHPLAFNPGSYFKSDEYFAAAAQKKPSPASSISIGHDVWIGEGAFLKAGISVGTGAIIAARALVLRDVEPYSIVGGIPARKIRYRFDKKLRDRLLRSEWWAKDVRSIAPFLGDPEAFVSAIEASCLPELSVNSVILSKGETGKYNVSLS